jgi:predicted RNA-binding protein YlxR (DUF448 family)
MTEKRNRGNGRRLFSATELVLDGSHETFYARKKDVLSLPSDINKHGIFRGEQSYIIEKRNLDNDEFYRKQTQNIRYTKLLCIVDDNDKQKILQKVPVVTVSSSKRGAYFIIDRNEVTKSVKEKQIRKQLQQIVKKEQKRKY